MRRGALLAVLVPLCLPVGDAAAQHVKTRTAYIIDVRGSATVTASVARPLDCSGLADGGAARSGTWRIAWRSPQRLPMRRFRHPSSGRRHYFAHWRLSRPTSFRLTTDERWDEQRIENPGDPVDEHRCSMVPRSCTGSGTRRENPQHKIDTFGRRVRFELVTDFPRRGFGGCAPRRFRIVPGDGMPTTRLGIKAAVPLRRLNRGRPFAVRFARTVRLRPYHSRSAEPWERWNGMLRYSVTWRLRPR